MSSLAKVDILLRKAMAFWTVQKVREEAQKRGIDTKGTKAVLIDRILRSLNSPVPVAKAAGSATAKATGKAVSATAPPPAKRRAIAKPPSEDDDDSDDIMDATHMGVDLVFDDEQDESSVDRTILYESAAVQRVAKQLSKNEVLSKEAKEKFEAFFKLPAAKEVAYADTDCAWHWTTNPEPIPSCIKSEKSFALLAEARRLMKTNAAFSCQGEILERDVVVHIKPLKKDFTDWASMEREQLAKIHAAGSDAPFGKGTKTVVDKTVRSSKEFNPAQFEIKDAEFLKLFGSDSSKSDILEKIRQTLAPNCSRIRSDLYKMLVYGPGDFFQPHVDTQRGPDMFGTLVVALPADCYGGALDVTHDGSHSVIQPCEESVQWIAFFGDCQHSVSRVFHGYRTCLTFNLMRDGPIQEPSVGTVDTVEQKLVKKIVEILRAEKEKDATKPTSIGHLLDHKYGLSLLTDSKSLKGPDAQLYQVAAAHPELDLFLTPVLIQLNGVGGMGNERVLDRSELDEDDANVTVRTWPIDPGHAQSAPKGAVNYAVICEQPLQELRVEFIEAESDKASRVGSSFRPSGNEGTAAAFTYVHGAILFRLKDSNATSNSKAEAVSRKRKR
eukprot:TRINITY_DN11977_c0_g1_i1.p1 TRINITY_DN11977_c0_g1~~TRINITY_DN11977_c0_g1_i1.p1  ORF type:complete len:620 (-),score=103.31 TRINITY_DN11977_c0_g1_i1:36-1868(-)